MTKDEDWDWLKGYKLPDTAPIATPTKIKKRRQHFIQVPWPWFERLNGAHGQTYRLALCLLYLHWKGNGAPIKLSNGMLEIDGISRQAKWRALTDLERLGLIQVERRPNRSPIVRCAANLSHP